MKMTYKYQLDFLIRQLVDLAGELDCMLEREIDEYLSRSRDLSAEAALERTVRNSFAAGVACCSEIVRRKLDLISRVLQER